jgi:AcrR family transcriptional regulator
LYYHIFKPARFLFRDSPWQREPHFGGKMVKIQEKRAVQRSKMPNGTEFQFVDKLLTTLPDLLNNPYIVGFSAIFAPVGNVASRYSFTNDHFKCLFEFMNPPVTTKDRLLAAACAVFAEKGFRDATVAEICDAAEANIAAVNYHFGNKETLYDAVWHHAFDLASSAYPIDGSLPPENPVLEDYIYSYANAILHRIFSETETGLFAKLLYHEMANPTLALDRIAEEALMPQTRFLGKVVHMEFEQHLSEEQIRSCMNCIIGQCVFFNFSRPLREHMIGKSTMTEDEIEQNARHIATFSMGGLKEIQKD